jgi:hypothetical protein
LPMFIQTQHDPPKSERCFPNPHPGYANAQ